MFIYIKKQYDVFLFTISLSEVHQTHWMFSGSSHFSPNHRSRYSVSLVNFWHFFTLFYNGRFLLIFPLLSFRLRPWGLIHASERRKRGDRLKLSEDTSRRTPLPNPRESTSRIASCANGGAPRSRGLDPFPATPRPDASVRFTFASRRSSRMADASEGDFFCF